MNRISLLSFLWFALLFASGKSLDPDSLKSAWKNKSLPDSVRFAAMDELANYWLFRNPDTSLYYADYGGRVAAKVGLPRWQASFYNTLGLAWYIKSDFSKALDHLYKSLDCWQKAGKKIGLARCYGNIGLVFHRQNEFVKAMEFQKKALAVFRQAKDKRGVANTLGNIGNVYDMQKDTLKAIEAHKEALANFREINFERGIATSHLNLADLFFDLGLYDSAFMHVNECIVIFKAGNNVKGLTTAYSIAGRIHNEKKNFHEAIKLCTLGKEIADQLEADEDKKNNCLCLSDAYKGTGNPGKALDYYKQYNSARDSLHDEEKAKEIARTEMRFVYEKKSAQDSILHSEAEKRQELRILEERKQRNYLYVISGITLLFGIAMYGRVRLTRKQKRIIQLQKEIVDEKNHEILDSIRYAERIQLAVMPGEEGFTKIFKDGFVLFKPKDIVSGDFYWISEGKEYDFYATADCTGHGVPGAFMSMLGINLFDEIVNEKNITDPGDILDVVRIKIIQALKQTGKSGENKDGMDVVLCRLNKARTELTYSAAYNPLWIISCGEVKEYAADKQPVGFFSEQVKQFTQHTVQLNRGDVIYTFTDGYADQFGGPKGKKFKYKQLNQFLLEIHEKNANEQKELLLEKFENWRGKLEQIDDVCVIGVKV